MQKITDLKPDHIWQYFQKILTIPRPSKNETAILNYLKTVCEDLDLKWVQDKAGNLMIRKPATSGMENAATVILQSHVDMVCEKNSDIDHNFNTDPINAYIENGWIRAKGTTLGADNGIGVAAQLAVLTDPQARHGTIECLFTVDEETGLTGAFNIAPDLLTGEILLNLDSEDDGEIFIGCAGGIDTLISFPVSFDTCPAGYRYFNLSVSGLLGGHSGDDIEKGRGNANKILTGLLKKISDEASLRLCHLEGGNLRNAIPREGNALIAIHRDSIKQVEKIVQEQAIAYSRVFVNEPALKIRLTEHHGMVEKAMHTESANRLIHTLLACPDGVIEMSRQMPGLVQTSTNLASVRTHAGKNKIEIVTSQRSSAEDSKFRLAEQVKTLFENEGATVVHSDTYPGWDPDPSSRILEIAKKSHIELFGAAPKVRAIHAGLECGLFLQKYPELEMISFGPTIRGAHSPDERLEISTVEKFWQLLLNILEKIPQK
jgi:dipeptidase D